MPVCVVLAQAAYACALRQPAEAILTPSPPAYPGGPPHSLRCVGAAKRAFMNTAGTCAPAAHAFDMPMARSWHVHSELVNKCVPEHVTGGCECKRGNGDHPQRGTEKESTLTKGHAARQLALLSQAFSMHHCRTAAVVYALHPHHDINTGTAKSAMERTWALAQVHLDAAEYGKIV